MPNTSDQPNQVPPLHGEIGQQLTGGTGPRGPVPDSGDDEVPAELHLVEAILRQDSVAWAIYLPPTTRVTSYAGGFPSAGASSLVSSSAETPASAPYQAAAAARRESRLQRLTFRVGMYAAVLLVVIGAFAVFHFGAGSRTTPINTGPDIQPSFRYPLVTGSKDIQTLDPALVTDPDSATPIKLIFPGLLTLDANGMVSPWAAAALPPFDTVSNTYTFKIWPGHKWSDGTPIDANTFAYAINRTLSPCTRSPAAYYLFPIKDAQAFANESCAADGMTIQGNIQSLIGDSLQVPDPQTLIIQLSAPAPYFLDVLTTPAGLAQPLQLINQYGKHWTNHLVDNGGFGGNLYKVQLWDHNGNLDLVRNDAFWGTKPSLREVAFHIYPSTQAEYSDYLAGRLDLGFPPTNPTQYQASRQRSDFSQMPLLAIRYYQPNWAEAPFNDVRVRQAFDLALNKDVLSNDVDLRSTIPSNHIVPQGMPGYDANLVGPDGSPSTSGNVAKATALMQSYANDKCGGQISKCTPITLVDSNDPAIVTDDHAAVQMWQTAFPGYPIQNTFMTADAFTRLMQTGPVPQIFGVEKLGDYPDPQDWLSLQFGPGTLLNVGLVSVPEANTLMALADQNLGPDRMTLYTQAEQLLVNSGTEIPVCQQLLSYTLPSYVHGLQFSSLGQVPLTSWQQIYLADH